MSKLADLKGHVPPLINDNKTNNLFTDSIYLSVLEPLHNKLVHLNNAEFAEKKSSIIETLKTLEKSILNSLEEKTNLSNKAEEYLKQIRFTILRLSEPSELDQNINNMRKNLFKRLHGVFSVFSNKLKKQEKRKTSESQRNTKETNNNSEINKEFGVNVKNIL